MLDYFWDQDAGVLIVAPRDPHAFDLIQVEANPQGDAPYLLGFGSLTKSVLGLVIINLPPIKPNDEVRLMVQAFPSGATSSQPASAQATAQSIRLHKAPPGDRTETMIWTVVRNAAADDLVPYIFQPNDQRPSDIVASLWSSHMEGNTLYPAQRGGEANALPVVRVTADHEKDENGDARVPVRFRLSFEAVSTGLPQAKTHLSVFSMSASDDVLPLLVGETRHVPTYGNRSEVELKVDATAEAFIPPDEVDDCGDDLLTGDGAPAYPRTAQIDFLDRILIEASPSAAFEYRLGKGRPFKLSSRGICALVYVGEGQLLEDTGTLLERLNGSADAPETETVFMVEMERHGHLINRRDLTEASELSVICGALISRAIQDGYGAAAARIKPYDFHDFLQAPCYFDLVVASDRIEDLSRFMQELARKGDAMDECDKAGLFAMHRLLDRIEAENESDDDRRIRHWAECQLEAGLGWNVVPAAVRADILSGLAAGLKWEGFDLGSMIDFLARPRNKEAISELHNFNNLLTALGALPMTVEAQFTTPSQLSARLRKLRHLGEDIADLVESAARSLQMGSFERLEPEDLLEDVISRQEAGRRRFSRRVRAFFNNRIAALERPLMLGDAEIDARQVHDRLAGHFLSRIADDCAMIERITAIGYADPLENVVAMDAADASREAASGTYRHPLDKEERDWLFSGQTADFPIVERWRTKLRQDYERHNQSIQAPADRT